MISMKTSSTFRSPRAIPISLFTDEEIKRETERRSILVRRTLHSSLLFSVNDRVFFDDFGRRFVLARTLARSQTRSIDLQEGQRRVDLQEEFLKIIVIWRYSVPDLCRRAKVMYCFTNWLRTKRDYLFIQITLLVFFICVSISRWLFPASISPMTWLLSTASNCDNMQCSSSSGSIQALLWALVQPTESTWLIPKRACYALLRFVDYQFQDREIIKLTNNFIDFQSSWLRDTRR